MNDDLRNLRKTLKVKQWQIADALGISVNTLCVRMRKELTPDAKAKIIKVIEMLSGKDVE